MKPIRFLESKIELAAPDDAANLIIKSDAYTKNLTRFDLQAKIKSTGELTENDYLLNATKYLYHWTEPEKELIQRIVNETLRKIKILKLNFSLPKDIFLIKSSMHEEGGANGFTRQNLIVLNKNSLSQPLFEHELFHIISRYNDKLIEKAYRLLGFKKCNEVLLNNPFVDFRISNPDAPNINYYINIKHKKIETAAVLVIYSKRPYSGGRFFSYVNKGLMLVEGPELQKTMIIENAYPKIIGFDEAEGFFEQVGTNTGYNIHQEEISAEHFVLGLNQVKGLPNQKLVDGLIKLFKG